MVSCYKEIAHQTLKNQPIGNAKIRCRLEKIDKTGNYTQLKKAVFNLSMRRLLNDANVLNIIGRLSLVYKKIIVYI